MTQCPSGRIEEVTTLPALGILQVKEDSREGQESSQKQSKKRSALLPASSLYKFVSVRKYFLVFSVVYKRVEQLINWLNLVPIVELLNRKMFGIGLVVINCDMCEVCCSWGCVSSMVLNICSENAALRGLLSILLCKYALRESFSTKQTHPNCTINGVILVIFSFFFSLL